MITSTAQAKRIQERRVAAGKRGYAKAVRRFLLQGSNYQEAKAQLPVTWEVPNPKSLAA